MDAIESLDWGVVSNFAFTLNKHPELLMLFTPAYYLGSYPSVATIVFVTMVLFLRQRNYRGALATVACFVLAIPNRYLPILQEGRIEGFRSKAGGD